MAETPRWAAPASGMLAVGGISVSSYLTWVHFHSPASLSCPNTGVINCLKVTTSAESSFVGIPVALLGILFFAGMAALCLPRAWQAERRWIAHSRMAGAVLGIGFALYLVAVELLVVHALCLWCTVAHVIAFALFVVVLAAALHVPSDLDAAAVGGDGRKGRAGISRPDRKGLGDGVDRRSSGGHGHAARRGAGPRRPSSAQRRGQRRPQDAARDRRT